MFGIVDNATHFLDAFIWGEDTANRVADNIVSCLNKYLTKYGVVGKEKSTSNQVSRSPNLKRLVIIADNCSGQNKNNCVIKLRNEPKQVSPPSGIFRTENCSGFGFRQGLALPLM